tara:strand:+ start:63 stop:404 length:342 start_codon:yes stop_codon:yes gene_type:complete
LNKDLVFYLLHDGPLDYFEIVKDETQNDRVHFYLEERNIIPQEYQSEKSESKGFSTEITAEDFTLRGKLELLYMKPKRWTLLNTGKIVKRDLDLIAKATRTTSEFASFLKDIT